MRIRDSGMPGEGDWESFFQPLDCLKALGLRPECQQLVDLGAGYGTFSLAAAEYIDGQVLALDSETDMVRRLQQRTRDAGLRNHQSLQRDFMASGSGLNHASADVVLAFNILHTDQPESIYQEARRILRPGGSLLVMHWRCDCPTPRGPNASIRPRPQQLLDWAVDNGFSPVAAEAVSLPPWHYGWQFKPRA